MYIISDLALKITTDCKVPTSILFKLRKEASVLESIIGSFKGEDMITQYSVFVFALNKICKIYLYLPRYRLAVECNEKGHKDRPLDYKIKYRRE